MMISMFDRDIRLSIRERVSGLLKGINYEDPLVRYRGSRVLRITNIVSEKNIDLPLSLAIDVFYTFYLPVPLLKDESEVPKDKKSDYLVLDSLLRSSHIHDIRSKTVVDTLMSSIAASVFLAEYKKLVEELSKKSSGVKTSLDHGKELKRELDRIAGSLSKDLDSIRKLRSLIEGDRPGNISMIAYEEYGPELVKLARNLEVRKILELLIGIKPWMFRIEKKRQRYKHGEVMGYEIGRDIERIVPSNLVLPDELFYLRYLENRLLLYQKAITEGRGSIYVLLDKSGSMDGLKMTWAKAVALSLYMRAIREKRDFFFRFFNSIPYPLSKVSRKPKANQVIKLIDHIARVKGSGGTDITRAIVTACSDVKTGAVSGVNDIVLITDGVDRIAEQVVRHNLKKANARLITVMVLGDNKSLKEVSAKYFTVVKLSQRDLLQIVEID